MKKFPFKFYKDFEFFIIEVTKELNRQGNLSSSWLKAIGSVLGIHVLAKILVNELQMSMPALLPGIGSISTGYKIQEAIKSSVEKYNKETTKFSEEDEKRRLKKAQIIFRELVGNKNTDDKIELLFEDFVSDEEIIY